MNEENLKLMTSKLNHNISNGKRYISLNGDLYLNPEDMDELIDYIKFDSRYYRISNKRFTYKILIIEQMLKLLKEDSTELILADLEIHLRGYLGVKNVNREELKNIFFYGKERLLLDDVYIQYGSLIEYSEANLKKNEKIEFLDRVTKKREIFTFSNNIFVNEMSENISTVYLQMMCIGDNFEKNFEAIFPTEIIEKPSIEFDNYLKSVENKVKKRHWICFYKYYFEGLTLSDIGKSLDLSRERVRQINSKITKVLVKNKKEIANIQFQMNKLSRYWDYVRVEEISENEFPFSRDSKELQIQINIYNHIMNTNLDFFEGYLFFKKIEEIRETFYQKNSDLIIKKEEFISVLVDIGIKYARWSYKVIIKIFPNVMFTEDYSFFMIKKGKFNISEIAVFILLNLKVPSHYSVVYNEFVKFFPDSKTSEHNILAVLDRSKDKGIIRTFTGTYGLTYLGAERHIFAIDLIIEEFLKLGRPAHYSEIIELVRDKTDAKLNTLYAFLSYSGEFISDGKGVYALKEWKNNLPEWKTSRKAVKQILSVMTNEHEDTETLYRITKGMIDNNGLRIPKTVEMHNKSILDLYTIDGMRFILNYYSDLRIVYGIKSILILKGLGEEDSFYIVYSDEKAVLYTLDEYMSCKNLDSSQFMTDSTSDGETESVDYDSIISSLFLED